MLVRPRGQGRNIGSGHGPATEPGTVVRKTGPNRSRGKATSCDHPRPAGRDWPAAAQPQALAHPDSCPCHCNYHVADTHLDGHPQARPRTAAEAQALAQAHARALRLRKVLINTLLEGVINVAVGLLFIIACVRAESETGYGVFISAPPRFPRSTAFRDHHHALHLVKCISALLCPSCMTLLSRDNCCLSTTRTPDLSCQEGQSS